MKPDSSFEAKVSIAFAAAAVVVAALSVAMWKLSADASDAAQWVAHTHEVLNSVAQARASTVQIELSTQNFRLTGNPAHLSERDALIATREATLQRMRELTSDNARQQERWSRLREVIDQRLAISRHIQMLRSTQGAEAANAYVATAPLSETRERTQQLLQELEAEENGLLQSRAAAQGRTRRLTTAASSLVAAFLFALLGTSYALIRRQLRENEASRRALADSEEDLSTTLHSIGDAVLATNADGRITRMNAVAERLTGWRLADAYGRSADEVFDIIDERTRARVVVPVRKVLETGEREEPANHVLLVARDGSERPIADSAAPIRDAAGRLRGVVLVFRDVGVERQARRMILEQHDRLEQRVRERTAQLRDSEEHLRSVIRNVPALIAYVDADQRYVYVNDQYRERFAPERTDIAGCTVREILGEARYATAAPVIAKALRGEPQSYDWQPFPGVWQVINYAPKRDDRGVVGYYVLGTDITERKTAEAKIRTLNADLERHVRELEHVSRALRTLSAGNRAMLRATDEQDLLDSMCGAIVAVGGYDAAVVWYRVDDEAGSLRAMAQTGHAAGLAGLQRAKPTSAGTEHGRDAVARTIRNAETTVVRGIAGDPGQALPTAGLHGYASLLVCPLRVGEGVVGALAIYDSEPDTFDPDEIRLLTESADDLAFGIATLRVRAEQRKSREAMHRLTHYDSLTGLPNETQFTEAVDAALQHGHARDLPFAVLQANIERLSEINDALGFRHGDELLCEFAARLRRVAPSAATVARLRGDEFALLLPDFDAAGAILVVRRLEWELEEPFAIADISLDVSAKIGVALFPQHGTTVHDLYRHMDIAVRLAKTKGVGHVVFDPARNPVPARRLTLVGELRRAIEHGDLVLHLQPKVEIASGRVCGAEGLVRWQHAEHGIIAPGEFIGLAEQTGLIRPLTEWVVETAMRLNQQWGRGGLALPIAVNLSARNLHDEKLLEKIRGLRTTYGIAAGLFEVEITESAVMEDAEFALHVLHGLRNESIALYIDDFGTGYSSLSYLQKLPVEFIKIDQTFIRDISVRKDSELIVRSTIDLIHDLGRRAVAEGIETRASWDRLAELGCDIGQGYFIAKPMPAEAFQAWAAQFRPPVAATST